MSEATPFKRGSVVAALDIGSSKMACFIARVTDDEGEMEIVGVGHQVSKGIKAGSVVDLAAAEHSIRQTVHAAESMAAKTMKGYPLREIILAVPALHTTSHAIDVDVQILGQDVTDNDINRALAKAQSRAISEDRELIHTIPVGYSLDNKTGIKDPKGMTGQRLGVDIHMMDGDLPALKNMASAVEQSHLDIVALCSAPYAAGLSTLVEDEMELGCTLIDMGAGTTSFAVFQQSRLLFAGSIPVGGAAVTSDIAQGLTTSVANAERIKTLYGSAIAASRDEHEYIDVPLLGEADDAQPHHVPRSLLVNIIRARLEETFEMVAQHLKDSGVSESVGRRLVLTGGASLLPGAQDLAKDILNKQVRLGAPIRLQGLPDATSGAAFSVAAGLLQYAAKRAHEMPTEIAAHGEAENLWARLRNWMRENW
ncbi:MAG: cell division protein FtsA [Pseudobdellovibrionaceae bacterium]|jgi:cell division protein FtsA